MPIILNYKTLNKFVPEDASSLAVAISGGADSMCLAYIANKWCEKNSIKLHALIVDHKLRANSTQEAKLVGRFLSSQNIANTILTWKSPKPKANVHHHARQMRYKLLTDYCRQHAIKHLLVAHNLSDQAETVLLRIFRGSGIDGIAGIPPVSEMDGIAIIRPLLESSRQDIEHTLFHAGWKWVDDPSNKDLKFERSKIRKIINSFEEKDILIKRLSLLAHNAQRARVFLEKHTEHVISQYVEFHALGYALINKEALKALDEEIALRTLSVLLKKIGRKAYPGRLESLFTLYNQLQAKGFKAHTLQGVQIRSYGDLLLFYREPSLVEPLKPIKKDIEAYWDNRFIITADINGFVGALGKKGYIAIKKHLKLLKKPPTIEVVYSLPALFNKGGKVIAVPHLQYFSQDIKVSLSECEKPIIPHFA